MEHSYNVENQPLQIATSAQLLLSVAVTCIYRNTQEDKTPASITFTFQCKRPGEHRSPTLRSHRTLELPQQKDMPMAQHQVLKWETAQLTDRVCGSRSGVCDIFWPVLQTATHQFSLPCSQINSLIPWSYGLNLKC